MEAIRAAIIVFAVWMLFGLGGAAPSLLGNFIDFRTIKDSKVLARRQREERWQLLLRLALPATLATLVAVLVNVGSAWLLEPQTFYFGLALVVVAVVVAFVVSMAIVIAIQSPVPSPIEFAAIRSDLHEAIEDNANSDAVEHWQRILMTAQSNKVRQASGRRNPGLNQIALESALQGTASSRTASPWRLGKRIHREYKSAWRAAWEAGRWFFYVSTVCAIAIFVLGASAGALVSGAARASVLLGAVLVMIIISFFMDWLRIRLLLASTVRLFWLLDNQEKQCLELLDQLRRRSNPRKRSGRIIHLLQKAATRLSAN